MATLRTPAIRYAYGLSRQYLQTPQRRWAQIHDVRFLATHQAPRIAEKYQEKLNRKARQEGFRDVNELKSAYKEKIKTQKLEAADAPQSGSQLNQPFSPPPPPSPSPAPIDSTTSSTGQTSTNPRSPAPPGVKTLSSFIDVPKTLELPQKEIEYVWRLRHASDPHSLCAVVPKPTYHRIESTARKHPQFILPLLRKDQGAEIHFLQWVFPTPTISNVLFTHLAEYKLRGEFSQPHTIVTHHLDLADPKGLVLLQGSVMNGRGISVDESKWLLMCLQKFYGAVEEKVERKKLLEQFSHGDGGFKVEELLEEAEKIV